jgi:hypothetical protein|nr:MAG TPA: hypothetical protein [Caudoviricetes sp.]
MSAKRLTTGITLEPAVMHYVRTKSKELGINGSQFIESCIGLEILNPLNHKTIPKAMKIAATVELIGLEKAREALAEDSDLILSVVPKETPIFEPEIKPLPKQGELPPSIKKIVEETVKKNIPTSEDIEAAASRGVFSSDISGVERNTNHDTNHGIKPNMNDKTNDVVNSIADDVVGKTSYDNTDKNNGSKTEKAEQIVNDITNRIEEINIDSVVNMGTEHGVNDNTETDVTRDTEEDFSDVKKTATKPEPEPKKKRIMKMI